MSMRPEDAAREASRFSLRTAFLGSVETPRPRTVLNNPQPQPHTEIPIFQETAFVPMKMDTFGSLNQTPACSQSQVLTFGSVVGHRAGGGMTQTRNMANNTGAEALRKIAAIQRSTAVQAATPGFRPIRGPETGGSASTSRVLQSGYINGGSARIEASAEIMRMSGLVDSMNGKLAVQAERLQRTEASLVLANRAMTSERAKYNGRMLKMQGDLKCVQAKEEKLTAKLSSETAFKRNKNTSFEEAVRKAEEVDANLQAYETRVSELTAELESANVNYKQTADALKVEKKRLAEREHMFVAMSDERDNAVAAAAASAAAAATAATPDENSTDVHLELEQKLAHLTSKHEELVEEKERYVRESQDVAESVCKTHASLAMERDELMLRVADMTSRSVEALKTVESLTGEVSNQRNQAVASAAAAESASLEVELLSKRVDAYESLPLQATGCGSYQTFEDDAYESENDGISCERSPYGSSYHRKQFYYGIKDDVPIQTSLPTTLFVQSDALHRRCKAVGAVRSNLHSLFDANERMNPAVAKAVPPATSSTLCILSAMVSSGGQHTDKPVLTDANSDSQERSMKAKIQKLVNAVSNDITEMVLQQRRSYLSASGMILQDIDADIGALTPEVDATAS